MDSRYCAYERNSSFETMLREYRAKEHDAQERVAVTVATSCSKLQELWIGDGLRAGISRDHPLTTVLGGIGTVGWQKKNLRLTE